MSEAAGYDFYVSLSACSSWDPSFAEADSSLMVGWGSLLDKKKILLQKYYRAKFLPIDNSSIKYGEKLKLYRAPRRMLTPNQTHW